MLTRRLLIRAGAATAGLALGEPLMMQDAVAAAGSVDLFKPVPVPRQVPSQSGLAELADTRLSYWDTGGPGPAVVLMHPASGSALMWGYQQPVLAKAGFRVIAYSRRGHFGSDPVAGTDGGIPSQDLLRLMDHLQVRTFSLVAAAAGCSVSLDLAVSRNERLRAVVFACGSFSGISEPDYVAMGQRVIVRGFEDMPAEFKELGPSYRAANAEGTKAWVELEHKAVSGKRSGTRNANKLDWPGIAGIRAPTLFLAGAADLYAPPVQVRLVASHVPHARMLVFPECGHSPHWEMPDAFNAAVVDFLKRHA